MSMIAATISISVLTMIVRIVKVQPTDMQIEYSEYNVTVLGMCLGGSETNMSMHPLLYDSGNINTMTSWYSIMHYAVSHHLSYAAISDLIELIKVSQLMVTSGK